ncbi:hypothetical protein BZG36_04266, partial [Bifiguratus adelaidae]
MAVSIDDLEPGDRVEYHPIGGGAAPNITTGVVVDLIVNDKRKYSYLHSRGLVLREGEREITVHASKTEPRILIQNDKTKKVAGVMIDEDLAVIEATMDNPAVLIQDDKTHKITVRRLDDLEKIVLKKAVDIEKLPYAK